MKLPIFPFAIISIIFIAGCIGQSQDKPFFILKDGERCIQYNFKADVRDIAEVPVAGKLGIQELLFSSSRLNILFESQPDDNPGFALASFAFTNKLAIYNLQVLGRVIEVQGYDTANQTYLDELNFSSRTGLDIILKGPNTGAEDTSVRLQDRAIVVQGNSTASLELAGERLALIMLEDLVDRRQHEEQLYAQRCKE
jgi:hypothetical protein